MTTTSWEVTAAQTFYLDIFSRRLKIYINQLLGRNYNHHSTPSFSVYVAFQIQTKVTCLLLLVLIWKLRNFLMECILLDLCFTSKSLSIYLQYWESLLGISLTINLALLCIALPIAFIAFTASDDVFQISISSISVSEDSYLEWWNWTWYKGKCREDLALYRIGISYLIKEQLCAAVVEFGIHFPVMAL